jgi:uncharacterized protein with LGFP repeats
MADEITLGGLAHSAGGAGGVSPIGNEESDPALESSQEYDREQMLSAATNATPIRVEVERPFTSIVSFSMRLALLSCAQPSGTVEAPKSRSKVVESSAGDHHM